jgi:glycosyltransferase involved in cell wall biosynthesis
MLSVIIPSRSPQYLQQTIDDLLSKAKGEIEIIVVFDGIWSPIKDDKRVKVIHQGTVHESPGMREGINKGVALSSGDYIMKIDEHCMVSEGFDLEVAIENTLVVPRRYRLDPDKWENIKDGRKPIDYMAIDYPFQRPYDDTCGLHGSIWEERAIERKDLVVDDLMTSQGSCYVLPRKLWDSVVKRLETEKYGPFTMECQEIMNKVWLSGNRCVVNKNCWYSHLHKGARGKGYGFSSKQYEVFMKDKEKGRQYAVDYWLTTKDFKYDFAWLVEKFWPIPGWPISWKDDILKDKEKDYRYSPNFNTWKAH